MIFSEELLEELQRDHTELRDWGWRDQKQQADETKQLT